MLSVVKVRALIAPFLIAFFILLPIVAHSTFTRPFPIHPTHPKKGIKSGFPAKPGGFFHSPCPNYLFFSDFTLNLTQGTNSRRWVRESITRPMMSHSSLWVNLRSLHPGWLDHRAVSDRLVLHQQTAPSLFETILPRIQFRSLSGLQ